MATMEYLLESAHALLSLLGPAEHADATRLLAISEAHFLHQEPDPGTWKREVAGLAERLARRGAAAIPLSALGRALLADWSGDARQKDLLLAEYQSKLALLGL
jgi:hypothetical protein